MRHVAGSELPAGLLRIVFSADGKGGFKMDYFIAGD
jgi:hypothetical protein